MTHTSRIAAIVALVAVALLAAADIGVAKPLAPDAR